MQVGVWSMTSLKNGMHEDEWLKGLWLFSRKSLAPIETTWKESLPPSRTNHMSKYTKILLQLMQKWELQARIYLYIICLIVDGHTAQYHRLTNSTCTYKNEHGKCD